MEFIIVTGLSGSGKSSVVNILEDIGFFCVDNIPPQLILKFAELCKDNEAIQKVALVTDIRGGSLFLNLDEQIIELRGNGFNVKLLFVDAGLGIVQTRYKETRRKHPLINLSVGGLEDAIAAENEILSPFREAADYYIDTSYMSLAKLKESVSGLFLDKITDSLTVCCMSFGFKYGIPNEADLVFDVRCLPNPFYVKTLKEKTGKDSEVVDFVMNSDVSKTLEDKLKDLLLFLVPQYVKEGKSQLVVAFGCTGGHHRSVTFAERFSLFLKENGYKISVLNRDISK